MYNNFNIAQVNNNKIDQQKYNFKNPYKIKKIVL